MGRFVSAARRAAASRLSVANSNDHWRHSESVIGHSSGLFILDSIPEV